MRIGASAALIATLLAVNGCSNDGNGNPLGPSGPPPTTMPIVYFAVGASDVIGFGSSSPCFIFEDCNGTGYVWVAARQLRARGYTVTVNSLGIPGAVISRPFQELGIQNGRPIGGNLIDQEMPFVRPTATLVTIFTGANDVNTIVAALGNGAGGSDPAGFIDQRVASFASDYNTLVSGIRNQAPSARIIVLNLPNLAGLPYLSGASLTQKQAAQRASVRMTTTAINTLQGVTVVDLMCSARAYQPSIFSADGFHPNDSGYAFFADEIVSALTSSSYPAPRSSCSQMTLF